MQLRSRTASIAATILLAAHSASAQVEWGELFGEAPPPPSGRTGATAPRVPPDQPLSPGAARTAKAPAAAPAARPVQLAGVARSKAPAFPAKAAQIDRDPPGVADRVEVSVPPAPPVAGVKRPLPTSHLVSLPELGLASGAIIDQRSASAHAGLFNPGMQWATARGWRVEVVEPAPIRAPSAYREATEKYAGQARLAADGRSLENHVAGRPFPRIDPNSPDAVLEIMWNYYYNFYVIDDVVLRDFHPRTGTIADDGRLQVERAYVVDSYRKLNYTARLFAEPKPELNNPERVRFKESVHPIVEPFDLKGVGFTAYRYLDPAKQDDSWLYVPQLRRVRRMSSAQRSDALFGQDTDADSYGGYNGHIGWMEYRLLGEQTVLAPMHARNCPLKWGSTHDWTFNDVWEPRRVWVVEAVPKLAQYAYGKRVLYVDQEAFLIPLTDSYDRAGQLWKTQVNVYAQKTEEAPNAVLSRYAEPMVFQLGTVVMDAQLEHATTSSMPSELARRPDTFLLNLGAKAGTTEDYFTVAHMMASAK